jgi:hypothetical protein
MDFSERLYTSLFAMQWRQNGTARHIYKSKPKPDCSDTDIFLHPFTPNSMTADFMLASRKLKDNRPMVC